MKFYHNIIALWYNNKGDKMNYLNALNKEQKEAVLTENKHVRVIAGAGSGKTRVLTTRIVHLVKDLGYRPSKICALTFTNKAANEMKERLEHMLDSDQSAHVSTIHALCVMIIRYEYEALNLVRNFTILDQSDQTTILREAYREFGYDRKELSHRDVLNYISNNKTARVSVEQAYKMAGSSMYEVRKAKVYDYYQKRLNDLFALDFDDLLLKVEALFKSNKEVLARWQRRFDVILVDEFQDVDHIQYAIVDSLVGHENALYVVGDPDQTIYSWRGANMNFIVDFDKNYPGSETITLHQNYRSTQNVLDSANNLIKHNTDRIDKELKSSKNQGEPIVYTEKDSEDDEGYWVARKMTGLHNQGVSYLDMAVLYRSNYLSRSLEKALTNLKIPYIVYGGLRFYDRQEIKDVMSYLRMVSHGDDLALRRSIAAPRRGIGDVTIGRLFEEATQKGLTIYEVMKQQVDAKQGGARLAAYVTLIEDLKTYFETDQSIMNLIARIVEVSGLRSAFEKDEEIERLENIKALMGEASDYQKDNLEWSLEEYVQMVSLYGDRDEVLEGEYVRLMTVHAAKGLEFDTVFMIGLNDDVFPNKNSVLEGKHGMNEERRLAYVAITRAMNRLFVSGNRGYSFVTGKSNRPSRFIKEMDHKNFMYELGSGSLSSQSQKEITMEKYEHPSTRKDNIKVRDLDIVIHDNFGEGVVVGMDKEFITIAFDHPIGIKKISRKFAGLRLKGDLT
jgi:DNA helicase II / ATP-dependent DNA helicase PcrA